MQDKNEKISRINCLIEKIKENENIVLEKDNILYKKSDSDFFYFSPLALYSLLDYYIENGADSKIETIARHCAKPQKKDQKAHYENEKENEDSFLIELSIDSSNEGKSINLCLKALEHDNYPNELPKLAIYHRDNLCINCEHVCFDDPKHRITNYNHCDPLTQTIKEYQKLCPEKLKRLNKIINTTICPFFEQTKKYNPYC